MLSSIVAFFKGKNWNQVGALCSLKFSLDSADYKISFKNKENKNLFASGEKKDSSIILFVFSYFLDGHKFISNISYWYVSPS